MAKILLVEDDNNLREIYEARLMAEGYEIVTARDGEEALTVAMKEKPDLIISDVMMPKISGFDMLDILRTTEETKNVKVIMMTALSQAEDKARAEKLGADRYLVKSQVTLEDVAKVAKEVLEGDSGGSVSSTPTPQPASSDNDLAVPVVSTPEPIEPAPTAPIQVVETPEPTPTVEESAAAPPAAPMAPAAPQPAPVAEPTPVPVAVTAPVEEPVAQQPVAPIEQTAVSEEKAIAEQIEGLMAQQAQASAPIPTAVTEPTTVPVVTPPAEPAPPATAPVVPEPIVQLTAPVPEPAIAPAPATVTPVIEEPTAQQAVEVKSNKRVIEPINDINADMKPKLDELLAKEEEAEQMSTVATNMMQQVASTTPASAPPTDEAIQPPSPDTKIDPNSIAL